MQHENHSIATGSNVDHACPTDAKIVSLALCLVLVVFLCKFCAKSLAIVSSVSTVKTYIKGCVCYCGQSLYSTRKLLALLVCQCGILTLYDSWPGTVAFSADGVCAYRSGEPQP